jgi:tRNA modification GTPase
VLPDNPQGAEDTIAAISTAPGTGAIAIVRLSGPDSITIADRVYRGAKALNSLPPRTVHRGRLVSRSSEPIDEVLAAVFIAPHSYTGENMVEFSCHGGALPSALALDALLEAGARAAGPGEFTKRAYLSGRLDLSQAEAVAQIVSARSRAGLKAALAQVDGALSSRVRGVRDALVGAKAEIEARLDFAEDVDEALDLVELSSSVARARADIETLSSAGSLGRLACEGARVVIAGRPNVGKSKLLNAIVGKDRAIVTPVPGTTRDTIEEWLEIDGVLLTLADTAGLHSTGDVVEAEGVRRAMALVRESQLVLGVLELAGEPSDLEIAVIEDLSREAPVIPVINKIDLGGDRAVWERALSSLARRVGASGAGEKSAPPGSGAGVDPGGRVKGGAPPRSAAWKGAALPHGGAPRVLQPAFVSALEGEGIGELKRRMVECLAGRKGDLSAGTGEVLLTTARHLESLRRAGCALDRAVEGMGKGLTEELLAFEIGSALDALAEITGESAAEDVVNEIFSRFCVGK